MVNRYVKIWHVRLGGANNMHPLNGGGGGGGGTNGKYPNNLLMQKAKAEVIDYII